MPRPTQAEMLADLQGLTPEQQQQYKDEVERRWPTTEPPATPPPATAEQAQEALDARPAFGRFIEGASKNMLPSWDAVMRLSQSALEGPSIGGFEVVDGKIQLKPAAKTQLAWDTLKGLAESHGKQFGKGVESLKEMATAPDIPLIDRLGHGVEAAGRFAAAATPAVGPAAADAGERIGSGDIAGGLGEAFGLLAPVAIARPIEFNPARLEQSASVQMAKALGSRPQDIPELVREGPRVIRKLGAGGTETLLERVKGEGALAKTGGSAHDPNSILGKAQTELEGVKTRGANIPIDLQPAATNVRGIPKLTTPPNAPVQGPVTVDPSEALVRATEAWARNIEKKAAAHGTTRRTWNPQTMQFDETVVPGPVPASEVFKMRTQAGEAGGPGFRAKGKPLVEPTAEQKAAVSVHGSLGDALKRAVPGLQEADLDYSTWRKVGDLLQDAAQKQAARKGAPALETLLVRNLGKGALASAGIGGGATAVAGGPVAAGALLGAGAYGMFKVTQEILNSPYWNSLRASQKIALADAIRNGAMTMAQQGARAMDVVAPATGRYIEESQQ